MILCKTSLTDPKVNKKIKPCPFKHDDNEQDLRVIRLSYDQFVVVCYECSAEGPTGIDEEQAIDVWNNRVKEND